MARLLQHAPPQPPEYGLQEMNASWKLLVTPEQRPTRQMNNINLANVFSVTLRESGEVAIIDGDTKEIVTTNLIELWTQTPSTIAEIKVGMKARSVERSKLEGWEEKYAIAGTPRAATPSPRRKSRTRSRWWIRAKASSRP